VASLFVIQGRDQGKRFELGESVCTVGRDNHNSIQLRDTEISRQHAQFRPLEDGFEVVDLKSSNGVFINSRRVEQQSLKTGDRIQMGRTMLIFTGNSSPPVSDISGAVGIVGEAAESRIVQSLSHEGSGVFGSIEGEAESPWLARAKSNLQVMYRTALAVSHTLDIDQLLHRIMELIFEWVETDRGCIMLVDQESNELVPRVHKSRQGDGESRLLISRTILDYVTEHNEGVLTSDAKDDDRWDAGGSIVTMGVREAICVPLQGRYGVVGVIYIDTYTPPGKLLTQTSPNRFNEEHLKLMVAIGHQAALAVEDTSYYSAMVQSERLAAMGQTIATLSHHIKNILQGIRGGSYLIEEGLKATEMEVIRKGWSIVEKNQEKISNLVMDMLSFSKEREPDMVPNDLNNIVNDVVELMSNRAKDAGVILSWAANETVTKLLLDEDALHRAVLNVVTNAIDACEGREKAEVSVSIEWASDKSNIAVVVADNGGGIPPEDLKKIFSVFESRKGNRGTGLGLPVSQKIVNEHGGDIDVESEVGVGSRFILRIPAVSPSGTGGTGKTGVFEPPE